MNWDTYGGMVRGNLAIIAVDLDAALDTDWQPSTSWAGYLWITSPRADADGLCLDDSAELSELEAAFGACLPGGRLCGRVTTGGRRQVYAYFPSADGFADAVAALQHRGSRMAELPDDAWEAGISHDPDHTLLQTLLLPPNDARPALTARAEAWASLPSEGSHLLEHEVYVQGDVAAFTAARVDEGFQVIDTDPEGGVVRFGRVEAFDRALAREVILDLVRRSALSGAQYLGFAATAPGR
jgi:hypothetical protein